MISHNVLFNVKDTDYIAMLDTENAGFIDILRANSDGFHDATDEELFFIFMELKDYLKNNIDTLNKINNNHSEGGPFDHNIDGDGGAMEFFELLKTPEDIKKFKTQKYEDMMYELFEFLHYVSR